MILRRVIEHFRKQEWTAIAIDFVIVVLGVFVGIQVSNWNAARADRGKAESYLERLVADLDSDVADYEDRQQYWATVLDYGAQGLAYAESRDLAGRSPWRVLVAFFQASQVAEFVTSSSTWDELRGAGDLGLIENIDLRRSLAQYHKYAGNPALSERPAYRENVRERIPYAVQRYIWANCYASTPDGRQSFVDCDAPIDDAASQAIIDRLASDEELMGELRYWLSTMDIAALIGRYRITAATEVRAAVMRELEGDR